jgi:hypothetical protein
VVILGHSLPRKVVSIWRVALTGDDSEARFGGGYIGTLDPSKPSVIETGIRQPISSDFETRTAVL